MVKRMMMLLLSLMLVIPAGAEEPSAQDGAQASAPETITLSFIGDCSIGDSIQYRTYQTSYHNTLAAKGYDWPFSLVKEVLAADDLTIANLEVVLTTRTKVRQQKTINLIGKPDFVNVLHAGSIEVVNTANNHAWDFGAEAYHEMMGYLDEAAIQHFGSIYPNSKDGTDICTIVEVKGVRIGFLGFSYPQEADKKRITNRIAALREQGAQLVVLSLHWGREEQPQPESGAALFAKYCIDAGADVIYGQHPHVLQSVQFYQGKPIFYSVGNFTFGSMSKVDPDTGIFQLTYRVVDGEPVLQRFSVVPCRTQGSGDYRPYILTDPDEITKMRKKLVHRRKVKNMTTVTEFFVENGYMDFTDGIAVGE
ncbi:MAG: CapA family protein [Aristaeellaceae bacterium]